MDRGSWLENTCTVDSRSRLVWCKFMLPCLRWEWASSLMPKPQNIQCGEWPCRACCPVRLELTRRRLNLAWSNGHTPILSSACGPLFLASLFFPSLQFWCFLFPRSKYFFFLWKVFFVLWVFFSFPGDVFVVPCGSCSLFAPVVLERIVAVRGSNLKQAEEGCWKQQRHYLSKEIWCTLVPQKTLLYLSFYLRMEHTFGEQKNLQIREQKNTILEGSTPTCKRKRPMLLESQAFVGKKTHKRENSAILFQEDNCAKKWKTPVKEQKTRRTPAHSDSEDRETTGVLSGASGKIEDLQPRFVRGGGRRKWVLRLHEGDLREGDARSSVMAAVAHRRLSLRDCLKRGALLDRLYGPSPSRSIG